MNRKIIAGELEKIANAVESGIVRKKTSASDPTVTATVFSREMAQDLNDMMDMLDETGKKYEGYAGEIAKADAKLRGLFNSKMIEEGDKEEIANIITNTLKNINLSDTVSSDLYNILEKYGNVGTDGRKSKYAIVESR